MSWKQRVRSFYLIFSFFFPLSFPTPFLIGSAATFEQKKNIQQVTWAQALVVGSLPGVFSFPPLFFFLLSSPLWITWVGWRH